MTAFVALLRGVNVGGRMAILMPVLKTIVEALGFAPAKTHLNSGNVVFATREKSRTRLVKQLEDAVETEFGFRPAIVIRSAAELRTIVDRNPFPDAAKADPSHLLVMCLATKADADAKAKLAKSYAGPEEIRISGDNVYLTYPDGIGRSKLTSALLERQLGAIGTARNWNTITKLLELAEAIEKT